MERLAAKMGGTTKFPYNDSECLDADFFKVSVVESRRVRILNHKMMHLKC